MDDVEPVTRRVLEEGRKLTAVDLIRARAAVHGSSRQMARFQQDYDVILTPTLGTPPGPHGLMSLSGSFDDHARGHDAFIPFTPLANWTGQPAMSVPLHWSADGLPVGVHFFGRFGDEATLFRLAAQLEKARPWRDKRPNL
jgi:amidase